MLENYIADVRNFILLLNNVAHDEYNCSSYFANYIILKLIQLLNYPRLRGENTFIICLLKIYMKIKFYYGYGILGLNSKNTLKLNIYYFIKNDDILVI